MKILVIGSSNMDITARVGHLPLPGETVSGKDYCKAFGGKGANQAVAAARLGGEVTFITSLGDDEAGEEMKLHFREEGINTDWIVTDSSSPSGTAFIFVSEKGENCIAVIPGANGTLTTERLSAADKAFEACDIVVLQGEIPHETVSQAIARAASLGKKVLFNPAPAYKVDEATLGRVDILIVNEVEAEVVSGTPFSTEKLPAIAEKLLRGGIKNVIITLGGDGVYMRNRIGEFRLSSYNCMFDVVDTVGAGDTFCGAIATRADKALLDLDDLRFANAAAGISVTRFGAQPSIPTLAEVEALLNESKK